MAEGTLENGSKSHVERRFFTKDNVNRMLDLWPLAVSADEGDLKKLHDMCSAGANGWRDPETLKWPDYLWLDLDYERQLPALPFKQAEVVVGEVPGQSNFKVYRGPCATAENVLPPNGTYRIRERPSCYVEVTAIDSDVIEKLRRYKPGALPWDAYRWKRSRLSATCSPQSGNRVVS